MNSENLTLGTSTALRCSPVFRVDCANQFCLQIQVPSPISNLANQGLLIQIPALFFEELVVESGILEELLEILGNVSQVYGFIDIQSHLLIQFLVDQTQLHTHLLLYLLVQIVQNILNIAGRLQTMSLSAIARVDIPDLEINALEGQISTNIRLAILQNDIVTVFAYAKLAHCGTGQLRYWTRHAVSWFLMLYKPTHHISFRMKKSYIWSMLQWAIDDLLEDCQSENECKQIGKAIKLIIKILIGRHKALAIRRNETVDHKFMGSCIKLIGIFLKNIKSAGVSTHKQQSGDILTKEESNDLNSIVSSSLFTDRIAQTYEIFLRIQFHIQLSKTSSWETKLECLNQLLVHTMDKESILSWIALYLLCEQIYLFSLEDFGEQATRVKVEFEISSLLIRICEVIPRQFLTHLYSTAASVDKDSEQLVMTIIEWDIIDLLFRTLNRPADKEQIVVLIDKVIEKLPKRYSIEVGYQDQDSNPQIYNFTVNLLRIRDRIKWNRTRLLSIIFQQNEECHESQFNLHQYLKLCINRQSSLRTYMYLNYIMRKTTILKWMQTLKNFTTAQVIKFIESFVFEFHVQETVIVYLLMETAVHCLMECLNTPETIEDSTIISISSCCISLSIFYRSIIKPLFLCKYCYVANIMAVCMNCGCPCRIFKCQAQEIMMISINQSGRRILDYLIGFQQHKMKYLTHGLRDNLLIWIKSLENIFQATKTYYFSEYTERI